MAFVVLSCHWMCWGSGRPRLGLGRQQILFAARSPCFPGKKQSKKMIHQRLSARHPATNIRLLTSRISDISGVWCLGRSPMFVGRGKNTVLFPSLWGPEDWGLPRVSSAKGKGEARPAA